jgi:WD40 repeat protein
VGQPRATISLSFSNGNSRPCGAGGASLTLYASPVAFHQTGSLASRYSLTFIQALIYSKLSGINIMLSPNHVLQARYRILNVIGKGGMGAVYLAVDQRFESYVALKETLFTEDRLRKAFEREARLLNSLRHSALPRVSDHFTESSGQFLVMEYIPGDDLAELLKHKGGPFLTAECLIWADQLLDALEYLHLQIPPIIHRDIKPQNLKLTPQGQIILLDFGLAKGIPLQMSRVNTGGSIFGYTPNYAPLEQIQGTGTSPRSDLYSLGATLYHLMTGVVPPDAVTRAAAVVTGQSDPLRPASELNPLVPAAVASVLQSSMAQNPDHRPQTANEMREAFVEASQRASGRFAPTASGNQALGAALAETMYAKDFPTPAERAGPTIYGEQMAEEERRRLEIEQQQRAAAEAEKVRLLREEAERQRRVEEERRRQLEEESWRRREAEGMQYSLAAEEAELRRVEEEIARRRAEMEKARRRAEEDAARHSEENRRRELEEQHRRAVEAEAARVAEAERLRREEAERRRLESQNMARTRAEEEAARRRAEQEVAHRLAEVERHRVEEEARQNSVAPSFAYTSMPHAQPVKSSRLPWVALGLVGLLVVGVIAVIAYNLSASPVALKYSLKGHTNFINALAFSPDSKVLATGSGDRTVRLWDTQTGELKRWLPEQRGLVLAVSFSPDGKTLASGSIIADEKGAVRGGEIKIWDAETGREERSLTSYNNSGVYAVAFSPDGQKLISGNSDQTVKLWDVRTGNLLRTLTEHPSQSSLSAPQVVAVAYSPDGRTVASASTDGAVKLSDAASGELKAQVARATGTPVYTVCFSPDGENLAIGSSDGTVWVWDVAGRTTKQTLKTYGGQVYSVNFSTNGKTLATGGNDGVLRLWDVQSGQQKEEEALKSGGSAIKAVAFSPDGHLLASGNMDRIAKLWDVSGMR